MFTENSNETSAHLYRSRRYGKSSIRVFVEKLRGTEGLSGKYENPILSTFVAAYYINHIVVDILHKVSFQNGFCPQGSAVDGCAVRVSPDSQFAGALGAAILARKQALRGRPIS